MLKKQNLQTIINRPESVYPFLAEITEKDLVYIFSNTACPDYTFDMLMKSGLPARMITSGVQTALIRACIKYVTHPDTLANCLINHNIRMSMDTLEWMAAYSPRTLIESGHKIPRVVVYYGICHSSSDARRVVMADYARKHSVPFTEKEIETMLIYHQTCLRSGLVDFLKKSNALAYKSIQKQIVTDRYLLNRIIADDKAKDVIQKLSLDVIDLALQTDSSLVMYIYGMLKRPTPETTMLFLKNATIKSDIEFFLRALGGDNYLYCNMLKNPAKYTDVNYKNMSKPLMIALINSYRIIPTLQWFKMMEMILRNNSNLPQYILSMMQAQDPAMARLIKRYVPQVSRLARVFDRVTTGVRNTVKKQK